MWSNNKKVDTLVNILIFLVAINFFHYGQFILPVICLILFVDRKFTFKVNNIKVFILLCLFGIAFCLFSYKLGFYCVMGFCLPMSYYIGSNIVNPNEENIKKLIYIIAFGMASHIILNMVYSYSIKGEDFLTSQGFYDIWLGSKVADTATAVNYVFSIGCFYYILFYEKKLPIKLIGLLTFIVILSYDAFLGRRTPILLFCLIFILTMILDFSIFHRSKKNFKTLLYIFLFIVLVALLGLYIYRNFLDNWGKVIVYYSTLLSKFRKEGLSSGRLELFIDSIKLVPYHLWGGQEISMILDIRPHDLILDTYDYAGIVPAMILLGYIIYTVYICIKYLTKNNLTKEHKVLMASLLLAIGVQLCLEPIMTGSSNFLMIVIILISVIEKAFINER